MGTKLYSVHFSPFGPGPDRDARFVADGFNWAAFLFGPLWAFTHRLWGTGLAMLLALIAFAVASEMLQLDPIADGALGLALSALFGFEANDRLRAGLAARGLAERGIASGRTLAEAELGWFRHHSASHAMAESAER
jgi:hypothetical protein